MITKADIVTTRTTRTVCLAMHDESSIRFLPENQGYKMVLLEVFKYCSTDEWT